MQEGGVRVASGFLFLFGFFFCLFGFGIWISGAIEWMVRPFVLPRNRRKSVPGVR